MSTAVTTAPVVTAELAVKTSQKLVTFVGSYLDAQSTVLRKFDSLVDQTKADIAEFKYDRKNARVMLQNAFEKAHNAAAVKAKVPADQLAAHVASLLQKSGPDISKVLTLSSPKDEAAAVESEKAQDPAALAAVGIHKPLGLNDRLEVARGNTTIAAIAAERANKAAGAKSETARPQSGTTSATPATGAQAPAPESAAISKLTPKERLENQFIAVVKYGESLGLSRAEVLSHLSDLLADATTDVEKDESAAK